MAATLKPFVHSQESRRTKTGGVSNACYACHVASVWPNQMDDFALQEEYAFSDFALTKAYLALVRSREAAGFAGGRDTVPAPPQNVHRRIENGSTDLALTGKVFRDGTLHLDWSWLDWNWLPGGN